MSEPDKLALFLAELVAGVSDGQVTAGGGPRRPGSRSPRSASPRSPSCA